MLEMTAGECRPTCLPVTDPQQLILCSMQFVVGKSLPSVPRAEASYTFSHVSSPFSSHWRAWPVKADAVFLTYRPHLRFTYRNTLLKKQTNKQQKQPPHIQDLNAEDNSQISSAVLRVALHSSPLGVYYLLLIAQPC